MTTLQKLGIVAVLVGLGVLGYGVLGPSFDPSMHGEKFMQTVGGGIVGVLGVLALIAFTGKREPEYEEDDDWD